MAQSIGKLEVSIKRQAKNEQGHWRNRPLLDIKKDATDAVVRCVKELAESCDATAGEPPPRNSVTASPQPASETWTITRPGGSFNEQFLLFPQEAARLVQEGLVDELETENATCRRLDWKPSVGVAMRQEKFLAALPPGKRRDNVEKALNRSLLDVNNVSKAGVPPPSSEYESAATASSAQISNTSRDRKREARGMDKHRADAAVSSSKSRKVEEEKHDTATRANASAIKRKTNSQSDLEEKCCRSCDPSNFFV